MCIYIRVIIYSLFIDNIHYPRVCIHESNRGRMNIHTSQSNAHHYQNLSFIFGIDRIF